MSYSFDVTALTRARATWLDNSDHVDAALRNLTAAATSELGSGALVSAADLFVNNWAAELTKMRDDSDQYAAAITSAVRLGLFVDVETAQRLQPSLPWQPLGPRAESW